MPRTFLVWSLFLGMALLGADWYIERGHAGLSISPSSSDGQLTAMEDGCPPLRPKKN